ncbi:MAG: dual specificity protein phosphatase family protein [Desulfurococcales archaeon]|nr:dual specificity protein phosphatase family protein [Desulfurococcales archaeon]
MAGSRCPYWVRPRLGGCRLPRHGEERMLASHGVTLLVSLVEEDEFYEYWPGGEREFIEAFNEVGIRVYRLPTPDFGAPDPIEACKALLEIDREIKSRGKVVVHCYGGIGRTGTLIAAYLEVFEGLSLEEAVEEVGRYGAGPEGSPEQWYFLQFIPLHCKAQLKGRM